VAGGIHIQVHLVVEGVACIPEVVAQEGVRMVQAEAVGPTLQVGVEVPRGIHGGEAVVPCFLALAALPFPTHLGVEVRLVCIRVEDH